MSSVADTLPTAPTPPSYEITSPYPGLRPFDRREVRIFFGRRRHKNEMLSLLRKVRFLGVVGTSGCGKSSLVKAGLIPELNAGWMLSSKPWTDVAKFPNWVSSRWFIAEMRPGAHPFRALASALLDSGALGSTWDKNAPESVPALAARLQMGPQQLIRQWQQAARSPNGNLLILVDQFEELFRFREGNDLSLAQSFVRSLIQLAKQQDWPVYIVTTMRSDFLGDCAQFPDLPEFLNEGQYLVPRLTTSEIQEAIEFPARMFGADFDELLVTRLLNDISNDSDQLPLLQHALKRMWELSVTNRHEHEQVSPESPYLLRIEDYDRKEIGGVTQALDLHAEELFKALPGDAPVDYSSAANANAANDSGDKRIARILFQALTLQDRGREVRRPTSLAVIAAIAEVDEADVRRVADVFRHPDVSILSPMLDRPLESDTKLDIAHESVIRKWGRLRAWIELEGRWALQYRRLRDEVDNKARFIFDTHLDNAVEWKRDCHPNEHWALRYETAETKSPALYEAAISLIDRSVDERKRRAEAEQQQERDRITADAEKRKNLVLRWMLFAVGLVAVVAIGLGVYAYQQRTEAELQREMALHQYERAEEQSKLATRRSEEAVQEREEAMRQKEIADGKTEAAEKSRMVAEEQRHIANAAEQSAIVARNEAEDQRVKAETARAHALESEREARQSELQANQASSRAFSQAANEARKSGDWIRATHNYLYVARSMSRAMASAETLRSVVLATQFASGNIIRTIPGFGSRAFANRTSSLMFAWGDGQVLTVWDIKAGKKTGSFEHRDNINGVILSNDESRILLWSASGGGRVTLWDLKSLDSPSEEASRDPIMQFDHGGPAYGAAFNESASQILTWGADGYARLWPISSGSRQELRHGEPVLGAQFNKTGSRILTWGDNAAKVWDLEKRTLLKSLEHKGQLAGAAFSPANEQILTWSRDNTARLWNLDRPTPVSFKHDGPVNGASFIPKSRIVTWSDDGKVRVWDSANGNRPVHDFNHGPPVIGARLNGNESRLLIWGGNAACLWDLEGPLINTWKHDNRVATAQFNSDEKQILTSSTDNSARVWDIARSPSDRARSELRALQTLGNDSIINGAQFTNRDTEILTWGGDRSLKRWHVTHPRLLDSFPEFSGTAPVLGARLSDDQKVLLAWRSHDLEGGNELAAFNREDDRFVPGSKLQKSVKGALLSRDGARSIAWSYNTLASMKVEMVEWEVRGNKIVREADLPSDHLAVLGASWNADEDRLLTWGGDNVATLWDMENSMKPRQRFEHQRSGTDGQPVVINGAAISRSGKLVLTWSSDRTTRLWDADSGEEKKRFTHPLNVKGAIFSSDEKNVVTWTERIADRESRKFVQIGAGAGGGRGEVRVWNIDRAEVSVTVEHDSAINGASLSPDGSRLLTCSDDGTAVLWNSASGERVQTFRHNGAVLGSKLLRDGALVLTWSRDNTAALWDVSRTFPLATFAHEDSVDGALTNHDDTRLLTWSRDRSMKWWDISLHDEHLTPDERMLEFEVRTATELNDAGEIVPLSEAEWRNRSERFTQEKAAGRLSAP